jgi:hypothetical protein
MIHPLVPHPPLLGFIVAEPALDLVPRTFEEAAVVVAATAATATIVAAFLTPPGGVVVPVVSHCCSSTDLDTHRTGVSGANC